MQQRILFTTTELYNLKHKGGIQAYNNDVLNALLAGKFPVSVVSMNDRFIDIPSSVNYVIPCKKGIFRKLFFVWELFKSMIFFKPELILNGYINFAWYVYILSKLFNVPYYNFAYGTEMWKLTGLNLFGFCKAQKNISISEYTKNKIIEQGVDYPKNNILLLPCTVDLAKFSPTPKNPDLLKKLGLNNESKIILTICRLVNSEQYKGYDQIIEIMPRLLKKYPNLKYILAGRGSDLPRIQEKIRLNNLSNSICLAGFISDEELVDYYNLCDVFAMPSKGEGFGIVFLEAISCYKPVISGNKDGSVDALLHGKLGQMVDPDNYEQLYQAFCAVFDDQLPEHLRNPKELKQLAEKEFGFSVFKQRLLKILETK